MEARPGCRDNAAAMRLVAAGDNVGRVSTTVPGV